MLFLLLVAFNSACPLESEEILLSAIAASSFIPTNDCIKNAQDRGWYDAATQLVIKAVEKEVSIDPSLKVSALAVKRRLEKFVTALEHSSTMQVVAPAYQWAQSPSMVYLDIKFSHRLDSPGCLEVANPQVNITDSKLTFIANCARSTQRIKINLDLEFYTQVNSSESSYSFTSVGRLNVNLRKLQDSSWPKPMKGRKPSNVHTWWEMKEKYSKLMKKYSDDDDEDDDKPRLKRSPDSPASTDKEDL